MPASSGTTSSATERRRPLRHSLRSLRRSSAPVEDPGSALRLAAWSQRAALVRAALDEAPAPAPLLTCPADLAGALGDVVDPRDRGHVWLVLSVLTGRFPD